MISLLVPSRGRPEAFEQFVESVKKTAINYEIILGLQRGDERLPEYNYDLADKHIIYDPGCSDLRLPVLYNILGAVAEGDLFMIAGDDMTFKYPGWDEQMLKVVPDDEICMIGFDHCRGDIGHPHPVITKKWYKTLGYVSWDGFFHWNCDVWVSELAKKVNRLLYLPQIKAPHRKNFDFHEPHKQKDRGTKSKKAQLNDNTLMEKLKRDGTLEAEADKLRMEMFSTQAEWARHIL